VQERTAAVFPAARPKHVMTNRRLVPVFLASLTLAGVVASAAPGAQTPKEPGATVLADSPLGAVTLNHKAHTKLYGAACDACHHASKAEKALATPHQKCGDCHTKSAVPPMTTKRQAAFHDVRGRKGTCIDCHQQALGKGKTNAPVKCADCHRKK